MYRLLVLHPACKKYGGMVEVGTD